LAYSAEDLQGVTRYWVGEVGPAGEVRRAFSSTEASFQPIAHLSLDLLFLNAFYAEPSTIGRASILNMATGELWRVAELIELSEAFGVDAAAGPFARVTTGGGCLNVRE